MVTEKKNHSFFFYSANQKIVLLGNGILSRIYGLLRGCVAGVIAFLCFYFQSLKTCLRIWPDAHASPTLPKIGNLKLHAFRKKGRIAYKYLNRTDSYKRWREGSLVVPEQKKTSELVIPISTSIYLVLGKVLKVFIQLCESMTVTLV